MSKLLTGTVGYHLGCNKTLWIKRIESHWDQSNKLFPDKQFSAQFPFFKLCHFFSAWKNETNKGWVGRWGPGFFLHTSVTLGYQTNSCVHTHTHRALSIFPVSSPLSQVCVRSATHTPTADDPSKQPLLLNHSSQMSSFYPYPKCNYRDINSKTDFGPEKYPRQLYYKTRAKCE